MEIVNPSCVVKEQKPGVDGIYESIEEAGRICYASEPKGNSKDFVDRMVKMGHGRPLEFGTVYLKSEPTILEKYKLNKYSEYSEVDGIAYVTTNYRVLVENNWLDDLKYFCEPTEYHKKRFIIRWTISRAIADEFRTHTTISSLMQSTRYCNYAKDKFGNKLTFVKSEWSNIPVGNIEYPIIYTQEFGALGEKEREYIRHLLNTECRYKLFTDTLKMKAEDARGILGLDIKTEFIQCATTDSWEHFFKLRCGIGAHPDAVRIAKEAQEQAFIHGFLTKKEE